MNISSLFSMRSSGDAKAHVAHTVSCYHCGLSVSKQLRHCLMIDGVQQPMCCVGCVAAAEFLQEVDTRLSQQG